MLTSALLAVKLIIKPPSKPSQASGKVDVTLWAFSEGWIMTYNGGIVEHLRLNSRVSNALDHIKALLLMVEINVNSQENSAPWKLPSGKVRLCNVWLICFQKPRLLISSFFWPC